MPRGLSSRLIGNVAWNFTGQGFLLLVSFFSLPFIVHRLGVLLYGIYVVVGVIIDYLSFLRFGMTDASEKYIAQYLGAKEEDRIRETFWSALGVHFLAGLAGMTVMILLAPWLVDSFLAPSPDLRDTARFAVRVGSAGFLLALLRGIAASAVRAAGRFDILNQLGIVFGILQTAAVVGVLYAGRSLEAVILASLIVQALSFGASLLLAGRLMPCLARPSFRLAAVRPLLRFGGFMTVSGVTGPILANMEKVFLTALQSVSALTFYAVPFSLVNRLSMIPSSVSSVLFPVFSFFQESDEGHVKKELHLRSTQYLFLLYLFPLMFLLFFGEPFLEKWLNREFAEQSRGLLVILGFAGLVNALAYPSITALQGVGKPHLPAAFHVVETILYIPAGYVLIQSLGAAGAALAWFLRVSLDAFLLHRASCRLFGVSLGDWYGSALGRALPPAALAGVLLWIIRGWGLDLLHPFSVAGILFTLMIYGLIAWKWTLDDLTKSRIAAFLRGA